MQAPGILKRSAAVHESAIGGGSFPCPARLTLWGSSVSRLVLEDAHYKSLNARGLFPPASNGRAYQGGSTTRLVPRVHEVHCARMRPPHVSVTVHWPVTGVSMYAHVRSESRYHGAVDHAVSQSNGTPSRVLASVTSSCANVPTGFVSTPQAVSKPVGT